LKKIRRKEEKKTGTVVGALLISDGSGMSCTVYLNMVEL